MPTCSDGRLLQLLDREGLPVVEFPQGARAHDGRDVTLVQGGPNRQLSHPGDQRHDADPALR